jgi:hypothetical protein
MFTKLCFAFTFVLFGFFTAFAQETEKSFIPKPKNNKQDMFMFQMHFDRFMPNNTGVKQKFLSRGVAVQLMYETIINKTSNFSFAAGGGFYSHNVFLEGALTRQLVDTVNYYTSFTPHADAAGVKRYKVSVNYVEIPVELRYRTTPNAKGHSYKFAVGARIGRLVDIHDKTINTAGKFKNYNIKDIEKYRYAINFRMGYGKVSWNTLYSFSPLITNGKGDVINFFSTGVVITLF